MRKFWPARPKAPWLVLWLGFGGLLVCIVGAAVGTITALDRVTGDETRIRQAFFQRSSALDTIRSQIYLSGTFVRDFLLSPDPSGAAAQAGRLTSLEGETRAALDSYSRLLDPGDRQPFLKLKSEIDDYWHILNRTVAWTPAERNRLRDSFFYDELVPRRTAMLQISDRIALVNERGLARSEDRLAQSSSNLRRTLLGTFAVTLAGGLVLALLTIAYTLRLERELERRLEENGRARADLRELSARLLRAQENERRALARELHDEVGQSLSAILMETENAECADDPREIREHLASVKTLAGKTVNVVRDLALLLRPSMLDDFGLVPALNWHAREMTKRTGLNVVVTAGDEADDLPDEHKTCIYRLVQEAVNNSARHANARNVEVMVQREQARVLFSVRDDGAGFDTRFVRGLGLLGMEERVRRLGGELRLDSQLGRGTVIAAELPLAQMNGANGNGNHPHPAG
ncbi:MAG TPA: sensor histidine kinase [Bryobacteraceae bacterium]|nr:sensor histidine kinase [Bryobacteraceae bacterium]